MNPHLTKILLIGCISIAATCLPGSAQGSPDFSLTGASSGDRFGSAISGIGDINGDGADDFIVGAPSDNNDNGTVTVYSGIDRSVLFSKNGGIAQGNAVRFGAAVSDAGDVNSDGVPDFMVGAHAATNLGVSSGCVRVYSGIDGSTIHTFYGTTDGALFGATMCAVDDLNNDGFDDVLIGAPAEDAGATANGSARVYSGLDGSVLASWSGTGPNFELGKVIANVGDTNGDGKRDFAIASPGYETAFSSGLGRVQVFSGADASLIREHTNAQSLSFIRTLSTVGDFNGDGFDDYAMNRRNGIFSTTSVTQIFSGINGLQIFATSTIFPETGEAIAGGGDLNNDGFDDFLISSRTPLGVRIVNLYSGITGDILFTVEGTLDYGSAIEIVGDTNNDGIDDVLVARPDRLGNQPGDVFGYFGFPGFLQRVTPYNSGVLAGGSQNDLVLSWTPDGGQPDAITGTMKCTGATPGALGRFGISLAPIEFNLIGFGIVQLIASDPVNLIATGGFGFDINGEITIPNVSLQSPFIGNSLLYAQFYEFSPFIQASNGLRMLIAP